jgi:type I restriction enzyme, R subunit
MVIDQPEYETQKRVIDLLQNELGYRYLGDWKERTNSNIEAELLEAYLHKSGYSPAQISRALEILRRESGNANRNLYPKNQAVYNLLRYGVPVKEEAGKVTETVHLINWHKPHQNDFAVAEEVTLRGNHERRPDVVLYVNGIAISVLELKRSSVSIGHGIRQNISNQQPEFNEWFFTTVQLVLAGNNAEGLRYGTIKTEEKYFLNWKEDEDDNHGYKLDKYLRKLCAPERMLELIHDFVVFDGGIKKLPRPHQYFGVKEAQKFVQRKEGGIIWQTQGSGKSIVMVLLAKWILENNPNARVVIVTDRDELDKQIERVFTATGEKVKRTRNGNQLMSLLGKATPRLLCSLVHKFGLRNVDNFDGFIKELKSQPSKTVGEVFVFVDECHRTQSGKLHRAMKAIMPNAVFIGFTGTPLLKKDRQSTLEVFGKYIHTYKFNEGVEDGIILDLVYEARDIDQSLLSTDRIDAWFDAKTRGLNDWRKNALMEKWGTMQNVLSSRSRMGRVVSDIIFDFSTKTRLSNGAGNALLVASSIYEACKYFSLFQQTEFRGKSGVITSYNPHAGHVSLEETGANTDTDKQFIYNTYVNLLQAADKPNTEAYEDWAKNLFINEPATMKLLVVVDKLLTGFDAPACTYLYIDKSMQDHGLFQAICRVNRLDGETKTVGHIVDYKNLLPKVESAISVYTSELDDSADGGEPDVLMQDRLEKGKEHFDAALERLDLLCEPVEPPRSDLEYLHYFCGNTEMAESLKEHEPQRSALYKNVVGLVRAYANIADELEEAGYTTSEITRLKQKMDDYLRLREIIRNAAEETLDLKTYEADMRHLIDTYIQAVEPRKISPLDDLGLLDLIERLGIIKATETRLGDLKGNPEAVAEVIENNVRSKIIRESLNDPAFYEKMSTLLDEIIATRKAKSIDYEEYLRQIGEIAKMVQNERDTDVPAELNSQGKRILYNNLKETASRVVDETGLYTTSEDPALDLALDIDKVVLANRYDGFRGVQSKEMEIKRVIHEIVQDVDEVERIFKIIAAPKSGY